MTTPKPDSTPDSSKQRERLRDNERRRERRHADEAYRLRGNEYRRLRRQRLMAESEQFRQQQAEYSKAYHLAHPDVAKKACKTYRANNRDKLLASYKKYDQEHKELRRNNNIEWFKKHPRTTARNRAYMLKKLYGITLEEWDDVFDSQGRVCAICGSEQPKGRVGWHTDHDHASDKVRGVLCSLCNVMLGHAGDSIALLEKAIAYLQNPPYGKLKGAK